MTGSGGHQLREENGITGWPCSDLAAGRGVQEQGRGGKSQLYLRRASVTLLLQKVASLSIHSQL